MRVRPRGAYAVAVRTLTLDLGDEWMPGLVRGTRESDDTIEVCDFALRRYSNQEATTERSFATLLAAII